MPVNLRNYDLLVVSDLHLSEGRDPLIKKFSLNEDFFFDEEFARMLDYQMHRISGRPPDKKWHLIINGDFLDFLQVVSTEIDAEFREYMQEANLPSLRWDPKHPDYGYACGPHETVYKLWKIMSGHWIFFEALANFLAEGNVVTIGRGNHDVEFIYPEVQRAFAPKLRKIYDSKLTRENDPDRQSKLKLFDRAVEEERVRFMDWFYYEEGLIWVEHGNQYDEVNAFKYWLSPLLPMADQKASDEIDLPWGSFFVRYLFNKVEMKEPFADNIKPQSKFVKWFLMRHPWMAVCFLFGDGRYMLRKMARAFRSLPAEAYAERREQHLQRLRQLAEDAKIEVDVLLSLDQKRAPSILVEPHGLWKFVRLLTRGWRVSLSLLTVLLIIVAVGAILFAAHALSPLMPQQVQELVWAAVQRWPWLEGIVDVFRWPLAVFVGLGAVGFISRLFGDTKSGGQCYLVSKARMISEMLEVQYVTMGHTHDSDLQSIGSNAQEYFNTGTWTKVFSEEEQLIRPPSELLFLEGVRRGDGMTVKLLQWEDGACEPRLVKLFR